MLPLQPCSLLCPSSSSFLSFPPVLYSFFKIFLFFRLCDKFCSYTFLRLPSFVFLCSSHSSSQVFTISSPCLPLLFLFVLLVSFPLPLYFLSDLFIHLYPAPSAPVHLFPLSFSSYSSSSSPSSSPSADTKWGLSNQPKHSRGCSSPLSPPPPLLSVPVTEVSPSL